MKKFILLAALGITAASYQPANAQVSVSINIGSQPQWGPKGYNHVEYYYLPEVQSYYHVPTRKFIYLERNKWTHRKSLQSKYRNYNLYQGRKIVINQPRPYLQHQQYQANYGRPIVSYQKGKKYNDSRYSKYSKHNDRKDKRKGRY